MHITRIRALGLFASSMALAATLGLIHTPSRLAAQTQIAPAYSYGGTSTYPTSGLYKATPGSFGVGILDDLNINDNKRNRSIPLKIYYPNASGSFPVIIFSHGGGGSKEAFAYLSNFWASQGYVVIHPTHADRDIRDEVGNDRKAFTQRANTDSTMWAGRAEDISAIIDTLGGLQQQIPALKGKLDVNRVGVAGHSFGAYTSFLVGGALVDTGSAQNTSFKDPRIKALIGISPTGGETRGLDSNAWSQVTMPFMTVAGTNDRGDTLRAEAYKFMPNGDKYHMVITGATHSSYNDAKGSRGGEGGGRRGGGRRNGGNGEQSGKTVSPDTQAYIHTYLESASVAFWDAYLKGDTSAKQYLKSSGPSNNSGGLVAFYSK